MKPCSCVCIVVVIFLLLVSCSSTNNRQHNTVPITELVSEYISIAEDYIELENYDKALDILSKAKEYDNNNTSVIFLIARTAALSENWNTALEHYNELLKRDTDNMLLKKSIAWIYAQSGDINKAEDEYESLYEKSNYDKEINTNYIAVLIAAEKYELANDVLDTFAAMYPEEDTLSELQSKLSSFIGDDKESENTEEQNNNSESTSSDIEEDFQNDELSTT